MALVIASEGVRTPTEVPTQQTVVAQSDERAAQRTADEPAATVRLSDQAREQQQQQVEGSEPSDEEASSNGQEELTEDQEQEVQRMKARDQEVRTHEQAHQAAGGAYASAPTYEFERGPDGKQYAVGGEVQIDVSEVPDDPEATMKKMQVVRRAALAPAEPSGQDRRVAAEASMKEAEARREATAQNAEEAQQAQGGDETEQARAPGQAPQPDAPAAEASAGLAAPSVPFNAQRAIRAYNAVAA